MFDTYIVRFHDIINWHNCWCNADIFMYGYIDTSIYLSLHHLLLFFVEHGSILMVVSQNRIVFPILLSSLSYSQVVGWLISWCFLYTVEQIMPMSRVPPDITLLLNWRCGWLCWDYHLLQFLSAILCKCWFCLLSC
jgi:hypothetical protein